MPLTHDLNKNEFNELDPWESILQKITWAIHSTHHITNKTSLSQLIFVETSCIS